MRGADARRVRNLAALAAGLFGFVVGYIGALAVAFSQDTSPDCDGVCFSDWTRYFAFGGGVVGAILLGYGAWRLAERGEGL